MMQWKAFTHLITLITTPSLFAYPQNHVSHVTPQQVNWFGDWWWGTQEQAVEWACPATFDGIMQMLDDLESGGLERKYPPEQLERINEYLAILAKEGILPDEFDEEAVLEEDAHDLMYGEDSVFELTRYLENRFEYTIIPLVERGYSGYNIVQCGKISKSWKKTKKFVKKHKKEIIIGAVVVVAVTVVAVAVVAASSASAASAAAGAAAAAAGAGSSDSSYSESKKSESNEDSSTTPTIPYEIYPPININETSVMGTTLIEQVSPFKEFLIEDKAAHQTNSSRDWDDMSFVEKAREAGAHIAHQAFDEVTDLVKVLPELCEEVKELGTWLLPHDLTPPSLEDTDRPIENYENWVAIGHKAVDSVFSTDQAELYTAEAKPNNPMNDYAIGVIPLPGMISSKGAINVKEFSKLGRVPDRAGYTKAGRGSMKHGYREGRTVFKKPIGNPTQINDHGQRVLDKILNHPEKKLVQYTHDIYGPVIEIEAPEIGGVRFTGDGKEMMGFLEPKWFKK